MQIFIHRNGQQTGPYSIDDVKAQLRSGVLQPTDLAWYEGAADWMPVSSVPGVTGHSLRVSSKQEIFVTESLGSGEAEPAKRPRSKTAIVLWMLGFGFFSLICLVTTLLMVAGPRQGDFPWKTLLGGLFLTVASISITAQLLVALRRGPSTGFCEHCQMRKPTISAGLNRHIGVIILYFHKSVSGHLCKQCISKVFWEYALITFFFGWWGAFSAFITPIVLINNAVVYARSLMMMARR